MDLISQTEGVRHNNTRCAAIVRKHPIIHARHINTEKVFQPRTITTTDNGSRYIMPSVGNTLFHSLYSQFRRIQPKINKADTISLILCLLDKIDIRTGRQCSFNRKLTPADNSSPMRFSISRPASIATLEGLKEKVPWRFHRH